MELGGKDAAYVAEDADFDHAVDNLEDGAFYNAGQSCCGIKRIFVHERHYDRFLEALVAKAAPIASGDPGDPATTMGPLATADAPGLLAGQVEEARRSGARVLCGGRPRQVEGRGRFLEPTVVADAAPGLAVMAEESFGPLVALARVRDDDEAVERINDSRFGLTAAIWSSGSRAREANRSPAPGWNGLHEPLRLPRSDVAVGRSQGIRPRPIALALGPPGAHARQELSLPAQQPLTRGRGCCEYQLEGDVTITGDRGAVLVFGRDIPDLPRHSPSLIRTLPYSVSTLSNRRSSSVRSTSLQRTPRLVDSRRIRSLSRSRSTARQTTVSRCPGRFFFMSKGPSAASSAP